MPVFPQIERLFWFHDRVKAGRFPNAGRLAEQFEISHKTAQRDITRLRDRLLAPLEYDAACKGHYFRQFRIAPLPLTIDSLMNFERLVSQLAEMPRILHSPHESHGGHDTTYC